MDKTPKNPRPTTLQVAADRSKDQSVTVMPTELGKRTYVTNPPSLVGLKVLHTLIAHAGSGMGDAVRHEINLSDFSDALGYKVSRPDLDHYMAELRLMGFREGDPSDPKSRIVNGGLLDIYYLNEEDEETGNCVVGWYFGRAFIDAVTKSEHWAILDRSTVYLCKHRSSVLLYQYITSVENLRYMKGESSFTVVDMRELVGVHGDVYKVTNKFHEKVMDVAVSELTRTSRFNVRYTPIKKGRKIVSYVLQWETKKAQKINQPKDMAPEEAVKTSIPAVIRAEFPASGGISFDPYWYKIFKDAGCKADNGMVADAFRGFLKEKGISRTAPHLDKAFSSFCKRYKTNF